MFLLKLSQGEEERAQALHEKLMVFDSMGGTPDVFTDKMLKRLDKLIEQKTPSWRVGEEMKKIGISEMAKNPEYRKIFCERLRKSGVTAVSTTVGALSGPIPFTYENALVDIARTEQQFDIMEDVLMKATKAEHVRKAKRDGKVALMINFQNTTHIETDIDKLEFFCQFGVRQVQLTYNMKNFVGDGCTERTDAGISHFGVEVVKRLNKLRMFVDVSHSGYHTTMDAIEISRDPVVFSHTNCRALSDHDRCKTDEQLQAVAEKGGYIGLTIINSFIHIEKVLRKEKVTIEDWLDHVDYLVKLVGIDHVGIGSDDSGYADTPIKFWEVANKELYKLGFRPEHKTEFGVSTEGFEHYTDIYPNMTRGLVSRGYSDQEIEKIMGGNYLRIMERVIG